MSVADVSTIIYDVIQQQRALHPDRPVLIGVAGAQGSGKTTACQLLEAANRPRFAYFSLDDVYLTKAERERRADWQACEDTEIGPDGKFRVVRVERPALHALFATRGPPGTHDIGLAGGLIARLLHGLPTDLPRFDKVQDDRAPESEWPRYEGKAEAILIDGWCLGATAPPMDAPLNAAEEDDAEGRWRSSASHELDGRYAPFFAAFDAIVYLKPPSWEIVRQWRGQQEEELLARALTAEEGAKLDRFLMHFERITRHMMAGGHTTDVVVELDEERRVLR